MTQHEIDYNCGKDSCAGCVHCQCGICKNCGLFEGALTTDCPLNHVSYETAQKIYGNGNLDFREGKWVAEPNPTNQDFIKRRNKTNGSI